MKRILILLFIALAAIPTTVDAQSSSKKKTQKNPVNVIEQLDEIINNYATENGESYEKIKNPNTNTIESFERIVNFSLPSTHSNILKLAGQAFQKDEELSYRLSHMVPNSGDLVNLNVITDNGKKRKSLRIRKNSLQEMWLMCCKNTENPQFRDAYAIVWEKRNDKIYGTIYMISSLRPDLFENAMETAGSSTFKIEGRVDENIKDSLYNIYIADTYEELNNVADDDYVACVPVINKRFSYSVELDKPKVGRLRCIFPDGSLCSAGIDLDFVPNETYNITVHNGYYDQDNDYEQRVGRFSGKSLITSQGVVVEDSCALVASSASEENPFRDLEAANKWYHNLDYVNKATFESELQKIDYKVKLIEEKYKRIPQLMGIINGTESRKTSWKNADGVFKSIKEVNAQIGKDVEGLLSTMNELLCPTEAILILHSRVLKEFLNPQTMFFNELSAKYGSLSKTARNCQKYINSLTEKHIKFGETYILNLPGIKLE